MPRGQKGNRVEDIVVSDDESLPALSPSSSLENLQETQNMESLDEEDYETQTQTPTQAEKKSDQKKKENATEVKETTSRAGNQQKVTPSSYGKGLVRPQKGIPRGTSKKVQFEESEVESDGSFQEQIEKAKFEKMRKFMNPSNPGFEAVKKAMNKKSGLEQAKSSNQTKTPEEIEANRKHKAQMIDEIPVQEDFSKKRVLVQPFKFKLAEGHYIYCDAETVPGTMKRDSYTYQTLNFAKRLQNGTYYPFDFNASLGREYLQGLTKAVKRIEKLNAIAKQEAAKAENDALEPKRRRIQPKASSSKTQPDQVEQN